MNENRNQNRNKLLERLVYWWRQIWLIADMNRWRLGNWLKTDWNFVPYLIEQKSFFCFKDVFNELTLK